MVVVEEERGSGVQFDATDLVQGEALHVRLTVQRGDVEAIQHVGDLRAGQLGGVFDRIDAVGLQRGGVVHPAEHCFERLRLARTVVRPANHVASGDRQVVGQEQRHRVARAGLDDGAVGRVDASDGGGQARWQHHHVVADAKHATCDATRVAAVVVVLGPLRANHVLHREARVDSVVVARGVHVLQMVQQRRALEPREVRRPAHDVVAEQGADGQERHVAQRQPRRETLELVTDAVEHVGRPFDQVHLVHADHQVRHAQQGGEQAVSPRLLDYAGSSVDQHDREVHVRCARDHVARVLDVAGAVGDDERTLRRGEVSVSHVDRDALLALGAQAVGEQRQVDVVGAATLADALDVLELVFEDAL